ncbi:glycerate kinase [Treponema zioleckii]|uniref:glycerate kinase family protein n=1 Tax=Treponema zioleckii TaxID=331680 RepID=UPI00168A5264|nr:glycerate kinase [Treponema zioleckii]
MKLLFASDSFKGTITSAESALMLEKAAREIFGESNVECTSIPVADGGEGTTDAVISACNGKKILVGVHGPLMESVEAYYGDLGTDETGKKSAIMEMAVASGLPMVPAEKRNPLNTTTFGTGELLRDALDKGFSNISIAIGGSATNDGGMGCMRALGVRFLDKDGNELLGCGSDLEKLVEIDTTGLDSRVKNATFTVMCDVTNPLCGKDGATYTFGKQKGATPEIQNRLEKGMQNYRDVIIKKFGINPDEIAGSGAAGGLGAALLVFLNAKLKSGIETVLDLTNFDERLKGVDLVVTGEGRTDWQSCFGKVVQGVGDRCKRAGVPAVALVGSMGEGAEKIFDHGICSMLPTVVDTITLEEALAHSKEAYYAGALRLFKFIKTGMGISR